MTFERGTRRDFDLVVGADGLHSQVRLLAFGAQDQFEDYTGIVVAAFGIAGYRPRDELTAVMHADVGFQLLRVSLREDVTMFCATLRERADVPLDSLDEQRALLRRRLAGARWETPAIFDALASARTFYFDRASQIRMPSWTRGRVALVGDAAACPSFLAGQGSALAMIEAYVLAAELARAKGVPADSKPREELRRSDVLVQKINVAALHLADGVAAAHAGQPRSAAEHIVAADALLATCPYFRHLLRAMALSSPNDLALADRGGVLWLQEALAWLAGTGEVRMIQWCQDRLRSLGGPVPRPDRDLEIVPPRLRALGVTGRELQVLRLLGQGLSNPEIAARLHLSRRTVETHVSHLLAKTGSSSRATLPRWLSEP